MAATIDAPAQCELRSVIRFLQAEGRSAAEIHRRMSKVYGENFMSDGSVWELSNGELAQERISTPSESL